MRKLLFALTLFVVNSLSFAQVSVNLLPPPPNQLKSTDLWRMVVISASPGSYKSFMITVDLREKTTGLQAEAKLSSVMISGSKSLSFNDFNQTGISYQNTKLQEAYAKNMNAPDGNYTICVYVKNEKGEEVARDCIDQSIVTPIPEAVIPQISVKLIPPPPNQLKSTDLWRIIATNASAAAYKAYLITVDLREKTTGAQAESKLNSVTIAGSKSFSFNDFNTTDLTYRNTKLQEAYGRNLNAPDGNYTICVYIKNERGEEVARDCIDQTIATPVPAEVIPQISVKLIPPPPNQLKSADLWRSVVINASAAAYNAFLITVELREKVSGLQAEGKINSVIISGSKSLSFNDFNLTGVAYHNTKFQEAYGKNQNAPDGNYTICIYVKNERGEEVARDCIDQTIVTIVPEKVSLQLITPPDGSTLILNQQVMFTWMLLSSKPGTAPNYSIKVAELSGTQALQEAITGNPAWFEKAGIMTPSLIYPVAARKFENGKKYVWQITAFTENYEIGKSEVWSFVYGNEKSPAKITEAKRCDVFKVEFKKTVTGDTISYKLLITNNYTGNFAGNKPGSFRITVKGDSIGSISGGVSKEWSRTPSKFPPGSGGVKWKSSSGEIPNGKTDLGNLVFRRNAFNPTKVVYEWLDKEEVLICRDSTAFIESRLYYELSDEIPNNYIEVQGNLLNIQFANNYASIDDIKYSIYNAAKYAVVKPQSEKSSRSNSTEKENKHFNSNGLNRITINLQDYTLQPKTTYLLIVSDSKHNFYLNFKVTNQNEK